MNSPIENSMEFSMSMFRNHDDMFAAMRDEIRRLRGSAPEWQPIETAPKDELLLLCDAKWPHTQFRGAPVPIKVGGYWDGSWHIFGASWAPTHWMPLPDAPK